MGEDDLASHGPDDVDDGPLSFPQSSAHSHIVDAFGTLRKFGSRPTYNARHEHYGQNTVINFISVVLPLPIPDGKLLGVSGST